MPKSARYTKNRKNHILNSRSFQRLILSHLPKKRKTKRNKKSQLSYPMTIRTFTNRRPR